MGAHELSGRQRHHPADDGMARRCVRPKAPADGVNHGVHPGVAALRSRADAVAAGGLPHHSGHHGRRAAAPLAGGAAGVVPAARARQGDGLLGARHRRRADHRAGAGRMAHRDLQLALGLLHQPARRHRLAADGAAVPLRPAVHQAPRGTRHRLLGHRPAGGRDRRAAVRARQGPGRRLVLVARDPPAHDRGGGRAGLAHHPRVAQPTTRWSTCTCSASAATPSACC